MIVRDVFLDVVIDGDVFFGLGLSEVEDLLSKFKDDYIDLKPKEIRSIPNCFAYFSDDADNNRFMCKIYKTSFDKDRWIMLMKDDCEGYALYKNPSDDAYELAWYHSKLEEPLSESEEERIRTCYNPNNKIR